MQKERVSKLETQHQRLHVEPGRLVGSVTLGGAKNSALRLLAASILTDHALCLTNYPADLLDAMIHVGMLRQLGKTVTIGSADSIVITEDRSLDRRLRWDGRSIRNTLLILGCLVARFGEGRVPLPGGCKLGERKHDIHVAALQALGAEVWNEDEDLCAVAPNGLVGTDVHLRLRSTGATENSILMATLARGTTRIWNPHVRPEILDLIAMLRSMGAEITVFGQQCIEVTGREGLGGAQHRIMPDNMEAITWLIASVITGGDIEIFDFPAADLEVVMAHLRAAGAQVYEGETSVIVRGGKSYPLEVSTGPHPGINSDVQPLLAAWAAQARGESRIIDLRFPGRYDYLAEFTRMGVQHEIKGDMLVINGMGGGLKGATVRALDLRAGAALALNALTATGETEIEDAWQIARGYVKFAEKLTSLGARCHWS